MKRYALAVFAMVVAVALWTAKSTSIEIGPPSPMAISVAATPPLVCATGLDGATYYDTDDDRLLVCVDDGTPAYEVVPTSTSPMVAPNGATSTVTCAAGTLGTIFYDTDAGTAAGADAGVLCVCDDNTANGYRYHPVARSVPGDAGVPVDLTGNSTTNCGT